VNSIRLQNFRSFRDTGTIELRPLTILVGANSSGKSSFLRFFPLMKQTVEAFSSAPLLWNGRYVDFGDFASIAHRGAKDPNVILTFELPGGAIANDDTGSKLTLTLCEQDSKTRISRLSLVLGEDTCELNVDSSGQVQTFLAGKQNVLELTPSVASEFPNPPLLQPIAGSISPGLQWDSLQLRVDQELKKSIDDLTHANTSAQSKDWLLQQLRYFARPSSFHEHLKALDGGKHWERKLAGTAPTSPRIQRMRRLLFAKTIPNILMQGSRWLTFTGQSVSYIAPFRKDPARFDRKQELSVLQIDPRGDNLAMFLLSLSKADREDFDQWTAQHFGFGIKIESTVSHVSILVDDGKGAFNLIDMGYGISQVLPVIAQCWLGTKRRPFYKRGFGTSSPPILTAIEQPELHLHPRLQTNLADLFVGVLNATQANNPTQSRLLSPTRLLIETHSEPLISRLGELVSEGKLDRKDCSVVMFHKDDKGVTQVRSTEFDEDGMLSEWPPGFLSA